MQHGLFDTADAWIMNYDDVAPAFVAARAGYDVWLGNSRGNTFSLGHTQYDPWKDEKEYWNFDWTEMGLYDIPATLDHITDVTGQEKIAYIGHSQGTTQMFVGLADMEDYYAQKLSLFVALAPVSMIPNTEVKLLKDAAYFYDVLDNAFSLFGIHSLLNNTWLTSSIGRDFCKYLNWFCLDLESLITGNTDFDSLDRFQVYVNHLPNGTSVKSIMHYAQNIREGRFQVFADEYNKIFPWG